MEEKVYKIRFPVVNKIGEMVVSKGRPPRLRKGDKLVVDSDRGRELVEFLGVSKESCPQNPRATFVRKATYLDRQKFKSFQKLSVRLFKELSVEAKNYGMNLRPLAVYVPLDNKRIFFYYTAPARVDFRRFIREMSKRYRKRIEMRQVGVRDALQMKGWIGVCGQKVCCANFAERFESINLSYISEQNLPNSPVKFTGICGRLKCCMAFEKANYLEKKFLPPASTPFCLLEGKREVTLLEVDPLRSLIVYQEGEAIKETDLASIVPDGFERLVRSYDCVGCACEERPAGEEEILTLQDFYAPKRFF